MREKEDEPGSESEVQSALQLHIQDAVLVEVMENSSTTRRPSSHTSAQLYTHAETYRHTFTRAVATLQ